MSPVRQGRYEVRRSYQKTRGGVRHMDSITVDDRTYKPVSVPPESGVHGASNMDWVTV